jgi:hypothetical protein
MNKITTIMKAPDDREVADRDISIIVKDGERKIVQKDSIIYIPFFREDETCLMIPDASKQMGMLSFSFPELKDWNLDWDQKSTNAYLEKLGIAIKQPIEIIPSPIFQKEDSTAFVQVQLLNFGWGNFQSLVKAETINWTKIRYQDLPNINSLSILHKYAMEWAFREIKDRY